MSPTANQSKSYVYPTLIFSTLSAIIGALLIFPSNREPSFSFFLWFALVLIGDIAVLQKMAKSLNLNFFSLALITSYLFLTLGFFVNTKNHLLNAFLLMLLLPIINANLVTDSLDKHFVFRYFYALVYFIATKFAGIFMFLADLIQINKLTHSSNKSLRKLGTGLKIFLLFLVTGLPVIFIVVLLLKSTNDNFSKWVNDIFGSLFSWSTLIPRIIFIVFTLPYLITEMYFVKEIAKISSEIKTKKLAFSASFNKTWVLLTLMTTAILNLFYVAYIWFDLWYDLYDVKKLVADKNYDSYSQLAVGRFWELIFISFINLVIIYFVTRPFRSIKEEGQKLLTNIFLSNAGLLLLNTLFLILSVHRRLSLYEEGYGFTNKRFLGHTFLPVLIAIIFLIFSTLIVKKFNKQVRISLALIVLFFATYIMLPTDYLTNKINYELAKSGRIVVYDPIYTRKNNYDYYGSIDPITSQQDFNFPKNDIDSKDGLFIAQELLSSNDIKLTTEQRTALEIAIQEFKDENKDLNWREINLSRVLLELNTVEKVDVYYKDRL